MGILSQLKQINTNDGKEDTPPSITTYIEYNLNDLQSQLNASKELCIVLLVWKYIMLYG